MDFFTSIATFFHKVLFVTGNIITIISAIFAIFFIFIISYSGVRLSEIRKKEKEHLDHEIALYAKHMAEHKKNTHDSSGASKNPRWNKVVSLVFSTNSADWKLAIIEADSMLDALMDQMGFKGENLGEKLKNADKDKFSDLSFAWEAHTVRNRIAHEGTAFELSSHEAKRVIALYEEIFRDFGFI